MVGDLDLEEKLELEQIWLVREFSTGKEDRNARRGAYAEYGRA